MDKSANIAAKIIRKIEYINIASITPEGLPWNTPVYTAYDRNLNFYWLSWKENQHSKNVRNNPNVFITIYDSTCAAGTGVGIYLQGAAKELHNPVEMIVGMKEVYARERHKLRAVKEFLTHYPRRVYRFTPKKIWINGDSDIDGNFIDIRTEIDLKAVREHLNHSPPA